jgi:hypothetical protein
MPCLSPSFKESVSQECIKLSGEKIRTGEHLMTRTLAKHAILILNQKHPITNDALRSALNRKGPFANTAGGKIVILGHLLAVAKIVGSGGDYFSIAGPVPQYS